MISKSLSFHKLQVLCTSCLTNTIPILPAYQLPWPKAVLLHLVKASIFFTYIVAYPTLNGIGFRHSLMVSDWHAGSYQ